MKTGPDQSALSITTKSSCGGFRFRFSAYLGNRNAVLIADMLEGGIVDPKLTANIPGPYLLGEAFGRQSGDPSPLYIGKTVISTLWHKMKSPCDVLLNSKSSLQIHPLASGRSPVHRPRIHPNSWDLPYTKQNTNSWYAVKSYYYKYYYN